ncbi:hypothetical protein AZE42_12162 [Rhizopogon vesiculosus]|uniref:Uncharacterized protein n=1 Tax=Rhizopogon vesiculosus TaxID=180088 RepID=A0A1J8Q231_9AGAM|nr:hypothetical protein AZE42_12162 [Rhizopogon vesiculosus]
MSHRSLVLAWCTVPLHTEQKITWHSERLVFCKAPRIWFVMLTTLGKFLLMLLVVGEEAAQTLVGQEVLKGGNKAIVKLLESMSTGSLVKMHLPRAHCAEAAEKILGIRLTVHKNAPLNPSANTQG